MYKILINLQYDGTNYHGWIKQSHSVTIQSCLEQSLQLICKQKQIKTYAVSKTDAGVHALAQKVIIELMFQPDLNRFIVALNKALPSDIYISDAIWVRSDFHFFNVKQKTYMYLINDQQWSLTHHRYALSWPKTSLEIDKLQAIFTSFMGHHDFSLFSGLTQQELTSKIINPVRSIDTITVSRKNGLVQIAFTAKGFIRHQIRYIVQTGLMCYQGKIDLPIIKAMLKGIGVKQPYKAKACGLVLTEVVLANNVVESHTNI